MNRCDNLCDSEDLRNKNINCMVDGRKWLWEDLWTHVSQPRGDLTFSVRSACTPSSWTYSPFFDELSINKLVIKSRVHRDIYRSVGIIQMLMIGKVRDPAGFLLYKLISITTTSLNWEKSCEVSQFSCVSCNPRGVVSRPALTRIVRTSCALGG